MRIGIDYDDTFTRDPQGWANFINMMSERGHMIYIVTWRDETEALRVHSEAQYWNLDIEGIYATDRKAKYKYMADKGIIIDVMIDDNPRAWIQDMETR